VEGGGGFHNDQFLCNPLSAAVPLSTALFAFFPCFRSISQPIPANHSYKNSRFGTVRPLATFSFNSPRSAPPTSSIRL
jgi:hypothetical protein